VTPPSAAADDRHVQGRSHGVERILTFTTTIVQPLARLCNWLQANPASAVRCALASVPPCRQSAAGILGRGTDVTIDGSGRWSEVPFAQGQSRVLAALSSSASTALRFAQAVWPLRTCGLRQRALAGPIGLEATVHEPGGRMVAALAGQFHVRLVNSARDTVPPNVLCHRRCLGRPCCRPRPQEHTGKGILPHALRDAALVRHNGSSRLPLGLRTRRENPPAAAVCGVSQSASAWIDSARPPEG
jgi:hypothetical protein